MDILYNGFDFLMNGLMKITAAIPYRAPARPVLQDTGKFNTNYPYIFGSGFWSWGQYKKGYGSLPYWGFFTGENFVSSMNESGLSAAAADVSPLGSAWDRACELYAQLTGTVVDYGRAHSEKYHHTRYGEDYTGKALITNWSEKNKINIICHSFGGPTSALFASILEYGCDEEKAVTTDGSLSPFFEGGKGDLIYSITGVAGAYNGTSLIVNEQALNDTLKALQKRLPLWKADPLYHTAEKLVEFFAPLLDGDTPSPDTGLYDMVPDNSVELNKKIKTVPNIYYFTIPCCTTKEDVKRNVQVPDFKITDYFFALIADIMGKTDTVTPGGIILGKEWQPNDGLVNTISETGPFNEEKTYLKCSPSKSVIQKNLAKGRYYVFETLNGSHNTLSGGTVRPCRYAKEYIFKLVEMINSL